MRRPPYPVPVGARQLPGCPPTNPWPQGSRLPFFLTCWEGPSRLGPVCSCIRQVWLYSCPPPSRTRAGFLQHYTYIPSLISLPSFHIASIREKCSISCFNAVQRTVLCSIIITDYIQVSQIVSWMYPRSENLWRKTAINQAVLRPLESLKENFYISRWPRKKK